MREVVGILHNIRSIHNVASMFRTSDGAGIKKLYLVGFTPEPTDDIGNLRPQFSKVSLGAEQNVEWKKVKTIEPLVVRLKKAGYFVAALELSRASRPYTDMGKVLKKKQKIAFIVGNEVDGVSRSVQKKCDAIFEIPMHGKKESLNVSVAFGIAAYEFARYTLCAQ